MAAHDKRFKDSRARIKDQPLYASSPTAFFSPDFPLRIDIMTIPSSSSSNSAWETVTSFADVVKKGLKPSDLPKELKDRLAEQLPRAKKYDPSQHGPARTAHITDPPVSNFDMCLRLEKVWKECEDIIENKERKENQTLAFTVIRHIQDGLYLDFTDNCVISYLVNLQYYINLLVRLKDDTLEADERIQLPTLMCVAPERPPLDAYEALRVIEVFGSDKWATNIADIDILEVLKKDGRRVAKAKLYLRRAEEFAHFLKKQITWKKDGSRLHHESTGTGSGKKGAVELCDEIHSRLDCCLEALAQKIVAVKRSYPDVEFNSSKV
ncbi:hypothetical protein BJ508DRAFT_84926 [Ascobolus immersus RN42]|uniref:Uncharacterized protein n=1 Tax=Ascobolus immersus RN42 TaxID=1160509 RepID=A0A3N4HE15_ASCIM|nr:hypothetical protein BJ508DRAFT_84926 [Ascobolus immersus RN42]